MSDSTFSHRVRASLEEHSSLPALLLDSSRHSYGELLAAATAQARAFQGELPPGPVGILAARSPDAYIAVLAAVLAGRAYVPLHPQFPLPRLAGMVSVAGCAGIIGDAASREVFERLHAGLGFDWRRSDALLVHQPASDAEHQARGEANASLAYILFTSGSTGHPKAIGITQANVSAYLDHATGAFGVRPGDRASQMFELTFDLSVHDLFVTWLGGGLLCVPPAGTTIAPARFIMDQGITHWFSVPSTAALLSRLRLLREGVFPSLQQSLFCGEALSANIADQWRKAAPNSSLWNLYGPTEATVAITAHQLPSNATEFFGHGIVPIGQPFPGHRVRIVMDGAEVETGELCLAGPQVSPGYLSDPAKTAEAFVTFAPSDGTWYRTGDLARRDAQGVLQFLGRLDSQIQLLGHRVELGEVEGALRTVSGGRTCAVIPWPPQQSTVESIVAFVEGGGSADDATALRQAIAALLPDYMVPSRIVFIPAMPLNPNGKIDRKALPSLIS